MSETSDRFERGVGVKRDVLTSLTGVAVSGASRGDLGCAQQDWIAGTSEEA